MAASRRPRRGASTALVLAAALTTALAGAQTATAATHRCGNMAFTDPPPDRGAGQIRAIDTSCRRARRVASVARICEPGCSYRAERFTCRARRDRRYLLEVYRYRCTRADGAVVTFLRS